MRELLKYLNNYKKECVLAPLFKMLEAVFELIVPLVIAYMIDRGIKGSEPKTITVCFVILLLLGLCGLAVSVTAQYFAAKAATGFSKDLRHDLFSHILTFGFSEIDNTGTSKLITRCTSDVNILQNGVNMFLRLFLRSPFIVLGAMIMAFTIDAVSALVFVFVIILLGIAVTLIMRANIPMLKMAQTKLDGVLGLVRENLSGARVIRAFTLEEHQINDFHGANSELTGVQMRAGSISGLLNPLTYVMINIAIVILIKVGDVRTDAGIITTGQVVALYNYMSQILLELIKFANLIVTLNRSFASAIRVNEIFDTQPSMKNGSIQYESSDESNVPLIEFKDVSLKYHQNADEAISNITFSINRKETFGIIGGTGSGKTSVCSLIPRFYDATGGKVLINGRDVKEYDLTSLRKSVHTVMQKAVLFEGTIRENLKWGNEDASDDELMKAVENAVCSEVVSVKGGLDAGIEAGGKNLSGGQRQRLSIARALAGRADILIFDDSSSALDHLTDQKLRQNIANLPNDPAVIMIAQRTVSVQDCDRILVLEDGQMAGLGTHEELLETCPVYKEIYDSQNRVADEVE
ncbi:MAG: ABC transporter ATP-binding protein/permease [Lachnospiraceae bacterium]|nr:ABC transporter ATP-binding protein/permease [Lachnospiraceae bacterium]